MPLPPLREVPRRPHLKALITQHYGTVRHFCFQARLELKSVSDIMQGWRKPYEREIPIFVKYLDTPAAQLFPDMFEDKKPEPEAVEDRENINADHLSAEGGGA